MKTLTLLLAMLSASILLSACGGGGYDDESEPMVTIPCAPNAFRNTENNCYVEIPASQLQEWNEKK